MGGENKDTQQDVAHIQRVGFSLDNTIMWWKPGNKAVQDQRSSAVSFLLKLSELTLCTQAAQSNQYRIESSNPKAAQTFIAYSGRESK